MNGKVRGIREGEAKDHTRAGIGNPQPGKAANAAEQHALGQHLLNKVFPTCSQCHANRSVGTTGCTPCQEEICDVSAGNQQDQRGDRHQQP